MKVCVENLKLDVSFATNKNLSHCGRKVCVLKEAFK